MDANNGLIVPKEKKRKISGLTVTQIAWPQQAGLVLHKLCGHNKRNYCSPTNCPQNKRALCYTHYVAARNKFIVPQLRGSKTSGLIVTQTVWPQHRLIPTQIRD
jgi:hypothetical protein